MSLSCCFEYIALVPWTISYGTMLLLPTFWTMMVWAVEPDAATVPVAMGVLLDDDVEGAAPNDRSIL